MKRKSGWKVEKFDTTRETVTKINRISENKISLEATPSASLNLSPVLNNKYKSENTSPIIDTNRHKYIKLCKLNLSSTKKKCIRNLSENVAKAEKNSKISSSEWIRLRKQLDESKKRNVKNKEFVILPETKQLLDRYENKSDDETDPITLVYTQDLEEDDGSESSNSKEIDCMNSPIKLVPNGKCSDSFSLRKKKRASPKNNGGISQNYAHKLDLLDPLNENLIQIEDISSTPRCKADIIECTPSPKKTSQCSDNISDIRSSQENSNIPSNFNNEDFQMENFKLSEKKKKFKSGTLARRLQILLKNQKNHLDIWKHELYLARTSNFNIPTDEEDGSIVALHINKLWNDYGAMILECRRFVSNEICLVVTELNCQKIVFNADMAVEILPPYFVKYLQYCNKSVKTYIDVIKIQKINETF